MYLVTVNENKFADQVVSTERNSISGLIIYMPCKFLNWIFSQFQSLMKLWTNNPSTGPLVNYSPMSNTAQFC